ncbi:M48 family metalloprotease, partial [Alphaproteobacteria bacterium]|nr:M48 family metalloprotease [Alphaproteobacteria bacterium]
KLNKSILSVNNYNKKISFKIINDNFPNAFVTKEDFLYISSGLLINAPDYIALLAVLAHEIGHIENHHVKQRKTEIDNLKNINSFGNILAIAGSMIIQEPDIINTVAFNNTVMKNSYLNFSKDQEREADIYAANTLNKLDLPTKSVFDFLKILEIKTKFNQIDDELKKFSTHPLFEERYQILKHKENNNNVANFDYDIQNEFNFIKAKFMAYTNQESQNKLSGDSKVYFQSIKLALSGNLLDSLKKLNSLILKKNDNFFLLETKADILLSFGYENEAIKFYKQVLKKHPNNDYIRFNIFTKSNYSNQNNIDIEEIFINNLHLIKLFPYNRDLLNEYYYLANNLKKKEWIKFFEILLSNIDQTKELNELYFKTEDSNLKKIIKIYI